MSLELAAPQSAWAQPRDVAPPVEAVIEIEQAPGSEACPDKEAVFRSIKRLFPEREFRQNSAAGSSTATARVTIRPLRPGHEAVLTLLPPRHGERVIREQDEDCRGLADALALAFVMLVAPPDSQPESDRAGSASKSDVPLAAKSPEASAAAPPSPEPQQKSERAPETASASGRPARSYRAGIGASLIGGLGVLSEPSLGVGGEVELFHRSGWGLSLQGIRLWSQPAEAEGGSVTLTLWALLAAPCYRIRLAAASHLDACLRFGTGSQHAKVEGFQSPQPATVPWQVLVPQLSYRQSFAGLGDLLSGFARIGFVGQLRPQSFSVRLADGSGQNAPIASAPKFGVMAELGLMFGTGLF